MLGAISRRLSQSGYDPLLLQPNDVGPEHRFDAAILIGVDSDDPLIAGLESRDVPLVGVDVRSASGSAVTSARTTPVGFAWRWRTSTPSATGASPTSRAR